MFAVIKELPQKDEVMQKGTEWFGSLYICTSPMSLYTGKDKRRISDTKYIRYVFEIEGRLAFQPERVLKQNYFFTGDWDNELPHLDSHSSS